MNGIVENLIAVPITAVSTWLAKVAWDRWGPWWGARAKKNRGFKGIWHGVHISQNPRDASVRTYSRHEYLFRVSGRGEITGKMKDTLTKPASTWTLKGQTFDAGFVLMDFDETKSRVAAVEFYTASLDDEVTHYGIFASVHYQDMAPFVSYIVLSRDELSDEEVERRFASFPSHQFYTGLGGVARTPKLSKPADESAKN